MRRYGLVDIPDQASDIDAVPITRTLTINGTTYDLSADRTWASVGTNIYNTDGTLTSNRTLTSGGFSLTFTGSNTASSAIARGILMNHTLVAAANNDVLVGLDVNPTFTNGAFTGVGNYGIRTSGQLRLSSYTTTTSYSGTIVGYLAFDSSGNILTTATPSSSMAIGGSITSATAGSVLFAGTSGVLQQDNANFFWNDSNNRLGIGTNTPAYDIHLLKNQNALTRQLIENTTIGTASRVVYQLLSDVSSGNVQFGKTSSTYTPNKIINSSDAYINNSTGGDIAILNDFATGKIKFAGGGSSTAQMTLTAAGRLLIGTTTESTYRLDVVGTAISTSTSTSSTTSTYGVIGSTNLTYSSGASLTGTVVINALQGGLNHTMGGNLTVPNSCVLSANIGVSGLRFTSGGTVTSTQASGSSRAISNFAALPIKNDLTVAGTISHFANFHGLSPYSTTATNLTFTNFYHILLNDTLQYTGIAITNKWGIYQEGATDNNHFNGKVLIKTTTDAGYELDVNGTSRANKFQLSALNTAPATSSSTGTLGEIRIDANHIYICTATNTWKRVAIATF